MYSPVHSPEYIFGDIEIVKATRKPCPVCGHPTGDCVGENASPLSVLGETSISADQDKILVEQDVTRQVQITPRISTTITVARAGTWITRAKAKELGIIR